MAEGSSRLSVIGDQKTEVRGQKAEDREQGAEGRGQEAKDRGDRLSVIIEREKGEGMRDEMKALFLNRRAKREWERRLCVIW